MSDQNKPGKSSYRVFTRLLRYARPYWFYLLIGVLSTLSVSYIDAMITWLIKPVINNLHHGSGLWYIHWMPVLFLGLCVVRSATSFSASYFVARAARTIVMRFRQMIFDHLLVLPAGFYDTHSSGSITSTIVYNVDQVAAASSSVLQNLLRDLSYIIFILIVMFILSWNLALLFIIVGPFVAYFLKKNSHRLRRLSVLLQQAMASITSLTEENTRGYKVVRLFGAQKSQSEVFHAAAKENKQRELKLVVSSSVNTSVVMMMASLPIAAALYFVTELSISTGAFIAFIVAMLNIQRPLRRITSANSDIQQGIAGSASIFRLLDRAPEKDTGQYEPTTCQGAIIFREVNFQYPTGNKLAVEGVNIDIKPGQMVAFVGRSGGGKSTLVQLLPRFYDATSGVISLDGRSINEYSLAFLRAKIAMVTQDTFLFNGTIRDNLLVALSSSTQAIDDEQLYRAVRQAGAIDFIDQLSHGLDTVIGDNGVLLSGGERQRIAIARAFLKNAPVLVLDEATASLDSESEKLIADAMESLTKSRTTIIVAHRLSTIIKADRIYAIDKGRVVESGTHSELLNKEGYYAQLFHLQHGKE